MKTLTKTKANIYNKNNKIEMKKIFLLHYTFYQQECMLSFSCSLSNSNVLTYNIDVLLLLIIIINNNNVYY